MTIQHPLQTKVSELNADPTWHMNKVRSLTSALSAHISGKHRLSMAAIAYRVNELLRYTVLIPIPIPLEEMICFTRATKFDGTETNHYYKKVSRLSYLPLNHAKRPELGRLNKEGERLFYCCWDVKHISLFASLAEIRAVDGDVVNILVSHTRPTTSPVRQDQFLYVTPIGINDYFHRGADLPFVLHNSYRQHYEFLTQNLRPRALRAMRDCDRFLVKVLSMEEVEGLYQVTSEIAQNCLGSPNIDGIVYPSTRFGGFPNIGMKIASVDSKLQHVGARSVEVHQDGKAYKTLYNGFIEGEKITWISADSPVTVDGVQVQSID